MAATKKFRVPGCAFCFLKPVGAGFSLRMALAPSLMQLDNKTPFAAERTVLQDKEGSDLLVVMVKCAYSLKNLQCLEPAEKQVPVQMADEYYGEPGESSVRYESDIVPRKPGTDIVLLGQAHAPKGRAATEMDVSLQVGTLRHVVRVFGDRHWKKTLGFWRASSPEMFVRMPLTYERAYGGKDLSRPEEKHHEGEARNPVGRGFRAAKSRLDHLSLPNLEDPADLIRSPDDRPAPVGFGFVCRHWQPRLGYAGTYDKQWRETRFPLLPKDFDERHFNGGDPRLFRLGFLQGSESVEILNASAEGPLRFRLPGRGPSVTITVDRREFPLSTQLDTLVIEPDEYRLTMMWRGSEEIHNRLHGVKRIAVN